MTLFTWIVENPDSLYKEVRITYATHLYFIEAGERDTGNRITYDRKYELQNAIQVAWEIM